MPTFGKLDDEMYRITTKLKNSIKEYNNQRKVLTNIIYTLDLLIILRNNVGTQYKSESLGSLGKQDPHISTSCFSSGIYYSQYYTKNPAFELYRFKIDNYLL